MVRTSQQAVCQFNSETSLPTNAPIKWLFRFSIGLLCSFLCLSTVQGAEPADREPSDEAVEKALEYLKNSQGDDGGWRARGGKNVAISSLSIMAFLSAGHVPGEGPYGPILDKGIRWVLDRQMPNGAIATDGQYLMYHHGISTLMLAEVAGMTPNKTLAAEIKRKLEKAVELILQAQRSGGLEAGGWRYTLRGFDSDISVTGWQVMALRAAKNLGCDVPPENIEHAVEFISRCYDPSSGGYRYRPGAQLTVACTGTSVLALEICGKEQHGKPELLKAGSFILEHPPWRSGNTFYAIYYCTQAMYQLGDNYWKVYRPRLHQELLRRQRANGSWEGEVASSYCTAMAVLALTVDYGFLPIYQRGEDRATKAEK
jgi:prenyltransferase beta subunit